MVKWGQIWCLFVFQVIEWSGPVTTQGHIEVKTDDVTIGESKNDFLWNFLNFIFLILFHYSSSQQFENTDFDDADNDGLDSN